MEPTERLDGSVAATGLEFDDRLLLARAHCALVFERRGGRLADTDVLSVADRWAVDPSRRADLDLMAGHLFAWLG